MQIGPDALRMLRYLAQLMTPCRNVRTPVAMSPQRIEWDYDEPRTAS